MVRAERRQAEVVGQFHERNGQRTGNRRHLRVAFCVADDVFIDFREGLYVIGTDMEGVAGRVVECENAGVGKIFCVNELIPVPAAPHRPDAPALVNELKQNGEQSQTAEINNGRATDNYGVEVRVLANHPFCFELGPAVIFHGIGGVVFNDGALHAFAPQTVGGSEHKLLDAGGAYGIEQIASAFNVGGAQLCGIDIAVSEQGGAVHHSVDGLRGKDLAQGAAIADIDLPADQVAMAVLIRTDVDADDAMA